MTSPGRGFAGRPWWLGVAVAATGGVWLYGALTLPQRATYAVVGPGVFPALIGAALVLLGVLLVVQVARGERFEPQEAEDVDTRQRPSRAAFWTTVAGAAVPVATMERLGFPLTAALSFAIVARALGSRRWPLDLVLGLLLGTAAWYGFSRLLGVTLPGFLPGVRG